MSQSADVGADYGALLVGGLFAFGFSGCVNVQFVVYWQIYSGESWTTQSLVIGIWLLDLLHSAFIATALWDTIIAHYGDLNYVDTITWSIGPTIAVTAMVTFLVQSFFAHRLYRLQREKFTVAGPLFLFSFVRLVAACITTAEMIKLKRYSAIGQPFPSWVITLGLCLSAFVDVAITTFLCYFLRSNRSRISSTNHLIDTLTFWTVQNGSVTSLAAITSLICWIIMPHNRIFLGIHFVIAKLHANSLLATLNARTKFRHQKYHTSSPMPPPHVEALSGHMFGNGDDAGRAYSQPYTTQMSLDGYPLQPVDLKHYRSIAVSVQRTVESKYDNGLDPDPLSATAKSAHSLQSPSAT